MYSGISYTGIMKLYFVRHGQTDINAGTVKDLAAQFDEPLNSDGVEQAKQLAEQLSDNKFNAIISSPAQRSLQTAQIINRFHNLDVQLDDAWRELFTVGYLDATSWHDAFDFDRETAVEGIEPIRDFFNRIYTALDSLKATYGKEDFVLVVSHGGTHQAVYAYVNKLPLTGNMRLSPMKNCEVRIYDINMENQIL